MTLFYQKDAGLNQGIQQAGSILGNVLMQQAQERKMQQDFSNINRLVEGKPLTTTLLQQILAQPGGQQYLSQFGPLVAPILQQQAQSQGDSAFLQNLLGNITGEGFQPMASSSPIQEAQRLQNSRSSVPRVAAQASTLSPGSNVPSISGVPNSPPEADSNRVGPREQTVYQQGGQAGMGLNPPQEAAALPQGMQRAPSLLEQLQQLPPEKKQAIALGLATHPRLKGLGELLQDQDKVGREIDAKREERNFKINTPLYEDVAATRKAIPEKQIALDRIEEAIQSGDVGRFTDWAAARVGLDPLKSDQAQILESAVKTFFLGDLQSIQGGRLNQLIEGNLLKALQSLGKSDAANQEITETLYALQDIAKERIKIFDDLSEAYDSAGRELPRNADKLIGERLEPFIKEKLSELSKTRKELREGKVRSNSAVQFRRAERRVAGSPPPDGTRWVVDPRGGIRAIPLNELNAAKKAGGRLLDE